MKHFPPPYVSATQFEDRLHELGAAVIAPEELCQWAGVQPEALQAMAPFWDELPPDTYLRDGGRYRFRRHGSFIAEGGRLSQQAHRAHWQPLDYNALHGGLERWFEPVQPALAALPAWQALLLRLARAADALKGTQPWFIETHQFRIDTTDGIGRPTPEGAHRDGVDLVAVFLVSRVGIKGGESRVFEAMGPRGERFTLQAPWTLLLLDDERVIHETTPIQPAADHGHRDTLVVTLRRGGFQDPA